MTPICPKCGSAAVESAGEGKRRCLRTSCGYVGASSKFSHGGPGTYRSPNTGWRDPIALTPGGYEDND